MNACAEDKLKLKAQDFLKMKVFIFKSKHIHLKRYRNTNLTLHEIFFIAAYLVEAREESRGKSGSTVLLKFSHNGHRNSFLSMSKLRLCRRRTVCRLLSFASTESKNLIK